MTNAAWLMLAAAVAGGCGSGEERTVETVEARAGSGRAGMEGVSTREETATPASRGPAAGSGRVVAGYYTDDGAPDPLECTSDDDCSYGGVLDATGCCWSFQDMNAAPMSKAYRAWTEEQRRGCASAECPPPPLPARPPDCLFTVTCVDARCTNAC